jgi:hypothetical protein
MSSTNLLPLQNYAQFFSVTLNGLIYNFRTYWNSQPDAGWVMDIADQNNNSLVQGIALVTGVDILRQYHYLGIAGQIYVVTKGDLLAAPTYAGLGSDTIVFYYEP